jgi:hypothetical protein
MIGTHANYRYPFLPQSKRPGLMPKADVESDSFRFKSVSVKRFRKGTYSISFDRSTFCAYKFRVDLFTRGPLQEKDSNGLSFNHAMFRRLSIHA